MPVDLRSDTVTRPTPAMRDAMASAEVGDDVFGEDPTVNRLQDAVAGLLGKEAGLFVPSGSMGNQLAVKTHTQPGDEVLLDRESHIFNYECGTPAVFSGVQLCSLDGKNGFFTARDVEAAVRPQNLHHPRTRLVCLENTHNRAGGTVCPPGRAEEVCRAAHAAGLAAHLDGARIWNACAASGRSASELAGPFDSVSVCFSKGLGAPVGSVLAGTAEFVGSARRFRKMMGGAMRQAGVLAAAALYALEHHRDRLAEDHAHARLFAAEVARLPGFSVDLETVETNMVLVRLDPAGPGAERTVRALRAKDVWVLATGPYRLRAVFHLDVSADQTAQAIEAFRAAAA